MKTALSPEATLALSRLQKSCMRREMCRWDADRKMIGWELPVAERRQVLELLCRDRFIDEQRYARAFARDKYRFSKWGKEKIRQGLKLRKIPPEDILCGLEEIPEDAEQKNLEILLQKKAGTLKAGTSLYDKKTKLIRYALGRGFRSDQVLRSIRKMGLDED